MFNALFTFAAAACEKPKFLGIIPSWYEYLPLKRDPTGRCSVHIDNFGAKDLPQLWLIVLAITDILLRVGGLVAIGFVIYGGIKYITSQGEPENTRAALNTIVHALVGLVIAILAAGTVSFIARQLG